jgi:hypothetical protein
LFLATIQRTSEVVTTLDEEELSPAWKDLVGKVDDVFPDDNPCFPPRRAVQLELKLEPGTTPASKAAYRLSPAEMDELKAQLAVLLEKGWYDQALAPGEHLFSSHLRRMGAFACALTFVP